MNRGFTLVELIIVILIISIIGVAGVTQFASAIAESTLAAASDEVAAALHFAQLKAASSGRPHRVTVLTGTNAEPRVQVESLTYVADFSNLGATTFPEAEVETGSYAFVPYPPEPTLVYDIDFALRDRVSGTQLVSAIFGASNVVIFDERGVPSDEGTVILRYSEWQMQVSLDGVSGKVTQSL